MQDKTRTKVSLTKNLLEYLYILFLVITLLCSSYLLIINIKEIIERSLGKETILSDMSWLNDKQAILFSFGWAFLLLILLIIMIFKTIYEKRKGSVILAILLWLIMIAQFYFESLVYFPWI